VNVEIPEIRYAKSGDLYIAYQVLGSGPLDLVVAPAFMSHVEQNWEWPARARMWHRVASFSRLIIFDRRGTGLSDRVSALASFDEMMDDIRAVMDAAGSERAALFGTAEGGPMCALFAATYPDRTSALVLYGTYAKGTESADYPWAPTEEHHRVVIETYDRKWGRKPVGVGKMAPSLYEDEAFRQWIVRAQRYAVSPGGAIAWYRMTTEIDIRHVLPAIRVPTLVCHVAGDRLFDVRGARYMAERIPGANYVELAGQDSLFGAVPGKSDALVDEIEEFLTGHRGAPEIDRVLATVLFTDMVSSTERASELGDRRWRDVLDSHDSISRREVERFRGRLVNTTGDGVLATFDGPARAISCARAIGDEVVKLGVEIRAGLHTGEVELRGEDVGGIAVNLAARVMGKAGPGEVLASSTVKDLVVGSGIEFEDRGSHELKGVPGEWRLYAVASE
jgi:class 3 adenylate cyclase